jgi:hypothetical protein
MKTTTAPHGTTTEATLELFVGEHELRGVRVRGSWRFWSSAWPALAESHEGAQAPDAIVTEFLRRALAPRPVVVRSELVARFTPET